MILKRLCTRVFLPLIFSLVILFMVVAVPINATEVEPVTEPGIADQSGDTDQKMNRNDEVLLVRD